MSLEVLGPVFLFAKNFSSSFPLDGVFGGLHNSTSYLLPAPESKHTADSPRCPPSRVNREEERGEGAKRPISKPHLLFHHEDLRLCSLQKRTIKYIQKYRRPIRNIFLKTEQIWALKI